MTEPPGLQPDQSASRWPAARHHLAGVALVLACIAFGTWVRVGATLAEPNFDAEDPRGVLKSDPALLYYFTERILDADGRIPADFHADPRVEYPELSDLPAMFTIFQEFWIAWGYRWFGGDMPLHTFAVWWMGLFASLTVVGVYWLALELTGRVRFGVLAAVLFVLTLANYRTLAFVLIREDFCLPWFALHLALLARAARVRSAVSFVLAALPLVLALSSWHALGFVVTVEAACVFAWFVRTGRTPFSTRGAWLFLVTLLVFALLVPVLRAKGAWLSLPVLMMLALLVASLVRRSALMRVGVGLVAVLALVGGAWLLQRHTSLGLGDYSHVFRFVMAKLATLGRLPDDPTSLEFEVRVLWQGPFATGSWPVLFQRTLVSTVFAGVAVAMVARGWLRGDGDERHNVLILFLVGAIGMAWLIQRLLVLPGLLGPVAVAVVLSRARLGAAPWLAGLCLVQGAALASEVIGYSTPWYQEPERREIRALVEWVDQNVPADEAVLGDFVNSSAILAHCGNPIVSQPKYETARSRERAEEYFTPFYRESPAAYVKLLRKYQCRYLLVDRSKVWGMRWLCGVPESLERPDPGTAAAMFLSTDDRALRQMPGLRLVYRSPPELGTDLMRLYRLED